MSSVTFKTQVRFKCQKRGRKQMCVGGEPEVPRPAGRVPRISRLTALAIRIEQLVRDGVIKDYAQAADLGHVSRARMSQIMNLLQLAPEIQEALLFLAPVERGRDPIDERDIRPIAAEWDWGRQQEMWKAPSSARTLLEASRWAAIH